MCQHRLGRTSGNVKGKEIPVRQFPCRPVAGQASGGVQCRHDVPALVRESVQRHGCPGGERLRRRHARKEAGHIGIGGVPRACRNAHRRRAPAASLHIRPEKAHQLRQVPGVREQRIALPQSPRTGRNRQRCLAIGHHPQATGRIRFADSQRHGRCIIAGVNTDPAGMRIRIRHEFYSASGTSVSGTGDGSTAGSSGQPGRP